MFKKESGNRTLANFQSFKCNRTNHGTSSSPTPSMAMDQDTQPVQVLLPRRETELGTRSPTNCCARQGWKAFELHVVQHTQERVSPLDRGGSAHPLNGGTTCQAAAAVRSITD